MRFDLKVNGEPRTVDVDPSRSLLGVLRGELDLTGTKYGCGEGECGSCTVLLGDEAVHACQTPMGEVGGRAITTIEGLEKGGVLHPVQQAFIDAGAMQCGYCTPGMIMAVVALLASKPRPTRKEIVRALDGNVCRCGTHLRVIAAVERAAEKLGASPGEAT